MTTLTCPKCHGTMRAYERNGVTVDQCTDCRGLFLDRGELERLAEAESAWHGESGVPDGRAREGRAYERVPREPVRADVHTAPYREPDRRYDQGYGEHGYAHKRKKRSFLEDLFD